MVPDAMMQLVTTIAAILMLAANYDVNGQLVGKYHLFNVRLHQRQLSVRL